MRSGKRDFILNQVLAETKRLGVGYIDLVQSHSIPDDVNLKELAVNLQYLKDNNLTRYI
ncbi:hypothetical protein GW750_06440 [bacterium]|nr:hypothetical protein [bacterium]